MSLPREILEVAGALRTDGHYVYASGRHGSAYVDKKRALDDPALLRLLAREIARRFACSDIEAVIGPESGGAMMAPVVAEELGRLRGRDIPWAPSMKTPKGGFEVPGTHIPLVKYLRTLVVDDILTTGSSLMKVLPTTARIGCRIVGISVLVNRGDVGARRLAAGLKVPLHLDALVRMKLESWPAEDCPLCKDGVPVHTDLGHG